MSNLPDLSKVELAQPLAGVQVIQDFPPIYDEIEAAFPHVKFNKAVLYCWGRIIYNPTGADIAPQLYAHEGVHCAQQGDDIKGWWRRYIDEEVFRFAQEVVAHKVEYQYLAENGNRNQRRMALKHVANRLASPLYGRLVTPERALRIIKEQLAA